MSEKYLKALAVFNTDSHTESQNSNEFMIENLFHKSSSSLGDRKNHHGQSTSFDLRSSQILKEGDQKL